jgi:hypothetical protein
MWRAPGLLVVSRCGGTALLRKLSGKLPSLCGGLPFENPAGRRVGKTFANKGRIHPSRLPLRNQSTNAHKRGDIGGEELRLVRGSTTGMTCIADCRESMMAKPRKIQPRPEATVIAEIDRIWAREIDGFWREANRAGAVPIGSNELISRSSPHDRRHVRTQALDGRNQ